MDDPPDDPDAQELIADGKAIAAIVLSVDDQNLFYIYNSTTASQGCMVLAGIYLQGSIGTLIALSRRMYKTQMALGQSVRSQVDALSDCFQ